MQRAPAHELIGTPRALPPVEQIPADHSDGPAKTPSIGSRLSTEPSSDLKKHSVITQSWEKKSWFFSFFLVCIERATKERSDNFDHRIVRFPLWTGTNKSSKQIETRRKGDDCSYACAITSAKRNRQSPRPRITRKNKTGKTSKKKSARRN